MKMLKEWFIRAPWGNIALASWGDLEGEPVFLVHGRQDSLSTFTPLLEYLPEKYHYVAMDLPGHGKSDAFPTGVALTRLLSISAIEVVMRHLGWLRFVYIGHSMGSELGLFYNTMNPGRIAKLILLDVKPALQRLQIADLPSYFKSFYEEYYNNYARYNLDDRVYTKEEALRAVMKARAMSRDQAEVILERNLKAVGNDKFKLSWDRRQKITAPSNFTPECYIEIFSRNMPPALLINAKQSRGNFYERGKDTVDRVCSELSRKSEDFYMIEVDGGHDVHFTNPERLEKDICLFLDRNFDFKSKL